MQACHEATGRSLISTPDLPKRSGLLASSLTAWWDTLHIWHERARQRAQLAELDQRLRHDMGLSDQDIEAEVRKWFWQP